MMHMNTGEFTRPACGGTVSFGAARNAIILASCWSPRTTPPAAGRRRHRAQAIIRSVFSDGARALRATLTPIHTSRPAAPPRRSLHQAAMSEASGTL